MVSQLPGTGPVLAFDCRPEMRGRPAPPNPSHARSPFMILAPILFTALTLAAAPQSMPASSPGPRRAHTLAYDEAHDRLVLAGGAGAELAPDATWSWNGKGWETISTAGPSSRRGSLAAFDAHISRIVLYGGQAGDEPTSPIFDETWILDGASWTKSSTPVLGERVHFAAAYDRTRQRVVLIGGFQPSTGTDLTDVWEWDKSTWNRLEVSAPKSLFASQLAYDERAKTLVLTSSRPSDRKVTTWSFDGRAFTKLDEDGPAIIWSGQSVITLGAAGGVLAFGGFDGKSPCSETWRWDGKHWSKLDVKGPAARLGLAMAFDHKRGRVLLYGGEDGTRTFADLWEFAGGAWKEVAVR